MEHPFYCKGKIISIGPGELNKQGRKAFCRWPGYFAYKKLNERLYPDAKKTDVVFPYNPQTSMRQLLEKADLRFDTYGKKRDNKSLRHFFICHQLAQSVPVWDLSRQVGANPVMIDTHYAPYVKTQQYQDSLLKKPIRELL